MSTTDSGLAPAPAPRIGVKLPVTLTFEGGVTSEGISENMSETGVLILTSVEEQPGAVATLKFQAFEASAEIVWTGATGENVRLGMRFVFVEPKGREFMRGFSEYLRAEGYRG